MSTTETSSQRVVSRQSIIHDRSMQIMAREGVVFNHDGALACFRRHGINTRGKTVWLTENQIFTLLEHAPAKFKLSARRRAHDQIIGPGHLVFAPGYGATAIINARGRPRQAKMFDYENFCKLIQTSTVVGINGFRMIAPSDIPPQTAHLDMLLSNLLLSDKPFIICPDSRHILQDCLYILAMTWGWTSETCGQTVTLALIPTVSPLRFSKEKIACLMAMADSNQACVLASPAPYADLFATAPIDLLARQNAAILAGVALVQLIRPGAPVVYGVTPPIGRQPLWMPEQTGLFTAIMQMAAFYKLPGRGSAGLTNAQSADAQAGAESMLTLLGAIRGGAGLVLNAIGNVQAHRAISFEKLLIDEDCCRLALRLIAAENRINAGMRQSDQAPLLHDTAPYSGFNVFQSNCDGADVQIDQLAANDVDQRLATYEKPDIDPTLEKELFEFVLRRKTAANA